jgi:predicted component of type VI protein secretion system
MCSKGHLAGNSFPIRGVIAIGRDPARCQVVYPADTKGISSLHCEVMQQAGSIILTDKGSTYGTFLAGGQKLAANQNVTLASGAVFYLADPKNEFRIL